MNSKKLKIYFMFTLFLCNFFMNSYNIYSADTYKNTATQTINNSTTGDTKVETQKNPYSADENTARTSTPIGGNITERSNTSTPTKQAYTTGTITENVGEDGNEFPSDIAPKRQFLTFVTNDGKEFHLIIDYLKNDQQVRMLTEVNESDLLNIIDKRARKEDGTIESEQEMETRLRKEIKAEYDKKEQERLKTEESVNAENTKSNKEKSSDIILYGFAGGAVIIIFMLKKFLSKKQKNNKSIDDNADISGEENIEEDEDDFTFEDDEDNR